MLQIVSQTNLDTVIFIGDDEPPHKITGLTLGLIKKKYICGGMGSTVTTFMKNSDNKNVEGLRVRFTKFDGSVPKYNNSYRNLRASLFKRTNINNNTTFTTTVSRGVTTRNQTEIIIKLTPATCDRKTLLDDNVLSKFTRHITTNENLTILPSISLTESLRDEVFTDLSKDKIMQEDKIKELNEQHQLKLDNVVMKIKNVETYHKSLYPYLILRQFSGTSNNSTQPITLSEFDKFINRKEIIDQCSIPKKSTRDRFIDLCNIFKDNTVLDKLKTNNFEFRNQSNNLIIEFFGIQLVREKDFNHFKYFDHPGINFCADYLERSNTFNILEAKISKEIITRI